MFLALGGNLYGLIIGGGLLPIKSGLAYRSPYQRGKEIRHTKTHCFYIIVHAVLGRHRALGLAEHGGFIEASDSEAY